MKSERGSVLIASVMISFLIFTSILLYSRAMMVQNQGEVKRVAGQTSLQMADSGINIAADRLRRPGLSNFLAIGASQQMNIDHEQGRISVTLLRRSNDPSLVDAYSTGYFYLNKGSGLDPETGKEAQIAVINAKFRVTNVSDYLLAAPSQLHIGYGTQATGGVVYSSDLIFSTGTGSPHTQIDMAYYHNTVDVPANTVDFRGVYSEPQRLTYAPDFVTLDETIRAAYTDQASDNPVPAFSGVVSPAADSQIYFVSGDLDIALGSPLVVQGVYVIYVTGDVRIHDSITLANSNSWLGILSERDILLAGDIPMNDLTLTGNFVCNGALKAVGAARTNTLTIHGGVVAGNEPQLSNVWKGSRNYEYGPSSNPDGLILPNISNMLQYTILRGKYAS